METSFDDCSTAASTADGVISFVNSIQVLSKSYENQGWAVGQSNGLSLTILINYTQC